MYLQKSGSGQNKVNKLSRGKQLKYNFVQNQLKSLSLLSGIILLKVSATKLQQSCH